MLNWKFKKLENFNLFYNCAAKSQKIRYQYIRLLKITKINQIINVTKILCGGKHQPVLHSEAIIESTQVGPNYLTEDYFKKLKYFSVIEHER